jgi:anti-sigma regulatory factor (Ser/Thr protein kinase)
MAAGLFVHQAVVYDTPQTLARIVGPVVQGALDRGESPIVVLDATNADAVRAEIDEPDRLDVADPDDVYTRPWRTFAAYVDTVLTRASAGDPILVVGEPPFATCDADDASDWLRVESALNIALDDVDGLMICPYRRATAGDAVMDGMVRVHPELRQLDACATSHGYVAPTDYLHESRHAILPELGEPDRELPFDASNLRAIHQAVSREAALAGLDATRVPELAVAVSELATNSVEHGGGHGTLRIWTRAQDLVCEIEDSGTLGESLLGMLPPDPVDPTGRGLWIARQFSDSLAIVDRPGGTVTRMRIATR